MRGVVVYQFVSHRVDVQINAIKYFLFYTKEYVYIYIAYVPKADAVLLM
jgi:hypothetical protein